MLKNPAVQLKADGRQYRCIARQLTEEDLRRHILTLRDSPPLLERVVFEIAPEP
jgi:hypothetical protein